MKPPPFGSGKPVRFDRKPVKIGKIQIQISFSSIGFHWLADRFGW